MNGRSHAYRLNEHVFFVHWAEETVAYDSESGDTHLLDGQASSLVRQLQEGRLLQHDAVSDMVTDSESAIHTLVHQLTQLRILLPISQP